MEEEKKKAEEERKKAEELKKAEVEQREFLYAALFRARGETIRAEFSYFGLNAF